MNKKKYLSTASFYLCAWLAYFALSYFIVSRSDDLVFRDGINRYGTFTGWIDFFSHNWGGDGLSRREFWS